MLSRLGLELGSLDKQGKPLGTSSYNCSTDQDQDSMVGEDVGLETPNPPGVLDSSSFTYGAVMQGLGAPADHENSRNARPSRSRPLAPVRQLPPLDSMLSSARGSGRSLSIPTPPNNEENEE